MQKREVIEGVNRFIVLDEGGVIENSSMTKCFEMARLTAILKWGNMAQ